MRGRKAISSESVENYIKAIYELHGAEGRVSTSSLAEYLNVAPPAVSAMLKRLSQQVPPMVEYKSHHGVMLTKEGRRQSMKIIRHHRLLETFLVKALGYSWDEVHDEADRLEHHVSERLEERIADYLGHPGYDPHGAPIPTKEGYLPRDTCVSLNRVREGQKVRVARVEDENREKLRYLRSLGLVPGVEFMIMQIAPFDGPIYIYVGAEGSGNRHAIGVALAESVMVEVMES